MKAYVYADTGTMTITVASSSETVNDIIDGDRIGIMDVEHRITTNTVRLAVGAMLAEAHLPASGWTIKVSNELTNNPS